MKRLIVNADDFGISERRNRGIVEAHRRGIVTSVSILANGAAFDHALALLKDCPGLDVGLHLNLSEGRPLLAGHRTLVDREGRFLGKKEARARAAGFDAGEVERETEAQIRRLLEIGLRVTHLDGHQHLHVYGVLAEPVARAARRAGVRYVRLPDEEGEDSQGSRVEDYKQLSGRAAPLYHEAGLRPAGRFRGVTWSYTPTLEELTAHLRSLRDGITELMVHPGYAETSDGFSGPDRERELEALTDPRARAVLVEEKIELVHFGKL